MVLPGFGLNDGTDIERKMTNSSGYLVSANPTNTHGLLKNIPTNGHWTKTGHALAASILFKDLLHYLETIKPRPGHPPDR